MYVFDVFDCFHLLPFRTLVFFSSPHDKIIQRLGRYGLTSFSRSGDIQYQRALLFFWNLQLSEFSHGCVGRRGYPLYFTYFGYEYPVRYAGGRNIENIERCVLYTINGGPALLAVGVEGRQAPSKSLTREEQRVKTIKHRMSIT